MKNQFLFLIVILALISGNAGAQTYVPVATTGYSLDGVAENTTAVLTTGGPLDNSDFVLYSQYYGTLFGGATVGLPNNGTIVSGTRTYQLQGYTGFNVQRINANLKDSITFITPQAFPAVSLLSFATQGSATLSVTVRFADNTTQVFSPIALDDWFTASTAVYSGFDRALRTTGVPALVGGVGNPRMFGVDLVISCANRGKPIKRIITQNNSTAFVCIMAVSGNVPAYSVTGPPFICTGSSATLSASGFATYTWQPAGSFAGSNSGTITVSPTAATSYTLSGTDNTACPGYTVVTVNVNGSLPVLSLTGSTQTVCLGSAATITASGASTYTLSSGSPNGGAFVPGATATYTVSGTNACGTSSATTIITVEAAPTVTASASSSTLCAGSGLTLTATGNATNYVWSGGTAPAGNGVGFIPAASMITYSVVGTNSLGCKALATIPVTVFATPLQSPVASPAIVCIGKSTTLTASGALSYTWTSATQTVFTATLVETPTTTGISTYTVIKSNSTCSDTKVISVVTNSLPTIFAIVTPTLICALNPATLAVGGGQTYTWTASTSTNTFNGPSPIVFPAVPTTYTVAASDGTCINTTTVALAVDPNPVITVTATSADICLGQPVTVNGNGGINYTVTSTNNSTFNTLPITESPTITTAYTFTGDNSFGCTASAVQVVVVHPNPTVNISTNRALVCSGNPATLTATGANNYTWTSNNALTNTTVVNPASTVSGPVIYTAMGAYTTGCTSSKTIAVNVFVPVLTVSGATNTCSGGLITLTGGGGNNGTYSWHTASGTNNFQTLTTTLTAPAVFTLNATTTSLTVNCPATKTIAVGINATPSIVAVAQRTTICIKESVQLHGQGGVSYVWSTSANTATITVAPTIQTNYTVTGTDANGCVSTGSVQIKVSNCLGLNELNGKNNTLLIFPNPNNGEFTVQAEEPLSLNVINELGQVVRTIGLSENNNYKVTVSDLSKGIYFISGLKIHQKVVVTK